MATEIAFPTNTTTPEQPTQPDVYVRALWSDPWQLVLTVDRLRVDEVVWSTSPTLPTATLTSRYGRIQVQGAGAFASWNKTRRLRTFVKIEWDLQPNPSRVWYGVILHDVDEMQGIRLNAADNLEVETGRQTLHAVGLERLLMDNPITDWVWEDSLGNEHRLNGKSPPFNAEGIGNRVANTTNVSFAFAEALQGASKWSSQDIADYLLTHHTPRDAGGVVQVPFDIDVASFARIPDFDSPVLPLNHQSVYSLLNRLIDRRRLLYWWCEVEELDDPQTDRVLIHVDTGTENALNVGPGQIAANSDPVNLRFDRDPLTNGALKVTDEQKAHQVIARGLPVRVAGSFSKSKGNWEQKWSVGDEQYYEQGASNDANYADWDKDEKIRANRDARAQAQAEAVFRYWGIPSDWSRKSWDFAANQAVDMFPANAADVWLPGLVIEPTTPFTTGNGVDAIEVPPLVWFEDPENAGRYVPADKVGQNADVEKTKESDEFAFSVFVSVSPDNRGVSLKVQGAPQWAIMAPHFTPLTEDEYRGAWDATNAVITVSMLDQHYTEARHPAQPDPGGTNWATIVLLETGRNFQAVYVAPGTVVGASDTGALIPHAGGYIRDDRPELQALAQTAFGFYGQTRRAVTLTSNRWDKGENRIRLGQLVVEVGDTSTPGGGQIPLGTGHRESVRSVVTQISITMGEGEGANVPPATTSIGTSNVELDAVQLWPVVTRSRVANVPQGFAPGMNQALRDALAPADVNFDSGTNQALRDALARSGEGATPDAFRRPTRGNRGGGLQ